MKTASLLFFSSSPIALPLFEALLKDERFEVLGLVCQPDRPAGRGQELSSPPTKLLAERYGVRVYQPEKLSKEVELLSELQNNPPDFLLTFAYGQLLSTPWLALPKREALNVHPSLLPLYRGPSPLEAALLHGDKETGICLMKMVTAMDAGPVAFKHSFELSEDTIVGDLYERVARLAAEWIPNDLFELSQKIDFEFVEQDEAQVVFCSKLSKEDAFEHFERSDTELLRRYRAFTPTLGLWTRFDGKRVKLLRIQGSEKNTSNGAVMAEGSQLYIGTLGNAVEILELQMEGKRVMNARDFLLAYPDFKAAVLPS